ncbi:hypothetical protein JXJ21_13285 [candidate division KSB1 bacterium]|nr:hypothetical protein [candidate division KSB1 bacterium]
MKLNCEHLIMPYRTRIFYLCVFYIIGLISQLYSTPRFTLEDYSDRILIKTEKLIIDFYKQPIRFSIKNRLKRTILTQPEKLSTGIEINGDTLSIARIISADKRENSAVLRCQLENDQPIHLTLSILAADVIGFELDAHQIQQTDAIFLRFVAGESEHYYGFGERLEGYANEDYDQRGTGVEMWRKGTQGVYVPFFMSTANYGMFIENGEKGVFDLAKSDSQILSIRYLTNHLKWTVFYGDFKQILNAYIRRYGRSILPPRWAFEPWKWRNEVKGGWELIEDADQHYKLNLPGGVMILDRPHFTAAMDFRFNPIQFPDIEKLLDELHQKGFRILLWAAPLVEGNSPIGREGISKGYFLKFKNGAPFSGNDFRVNKNAKSQWDIYYVDFTNPDAVRWWQRNLIRMLNLGFDGFKLDRSDEMLPQTPEVIYHNGKSADKMYNDYGTLYIKTFYDACKQVKDRDFIIYSRPGFSGSQQYAAFFSGDTDPTWEHFRKNLITALRASLSGFPIWGHEAGGYRCKDRFGMLPTRECFIRWTQFGAFSPIMDRGGLYYEEPWDWDVETLDIYRTYAWMHSELVPYIQSCAFEANATGMPIIRPLILLYPDDPRVISINDEYLFGDAFLVAPIYDSTAAGRSVYLPAGRWINYWNQKEIITGPCQIVVNPPLNQLPLFIKSGAIIPRNVRNAATGHGTHFSAGHLTLDVYPDGISDYIRHDDTGAHPVRCEQTGTTTRLSFKKNDQPLIIRIKSQSAPNQVTIDTDARLNQFRKLSQLAHSEGWVYVNDDHRIWIKVRAIENFVLDIDYGTAFSDWSFPQLISNCRDGISISAISAPTLKHAQLVSSANQSPEQRSGAISDANGVLEFMLQPGAKFQGEIQFYIEGKNHRNQLIRTGIKSLIVDADTTGPVFSNWSFPDTVANDEDFKIEVEITDPSGVCHSKWGHAPFQIYWRYGDQQRQSYGEKRASVFSEKNQTRYPRFRANRFSFMIPAIGEAYEGHLFFKIEAWDYDDIPAKSISDEKSIYVKLRK